MTLKLGVPERARDGICCSFEPDDDERDARPPGRRALTRARLLFAGIGALGMATLMLPQQNANGAASPAKATAALTAPAWTDPAPAPRLFTLAAAAQFGSPMRYAARRQVGGAGRDDILSVGPPDATGPSLSLSIRRDGTPTPARPSLFVDLARRAAEAGQAITRAAQPILLQTRFGPFEAEAVTLVGTAGAAPCLGFRLAAEADRPEVAGFACGSAAKPFDAARLACLIDGLDATAWGSDAALDRFFRAADRSQANACPQQAKADAANVSQPDPTPAPAGLNRAGRKKRSGAV